MRKIRLPRTAPTTTPGYSNEHGQTVVRSTGVPSTSFAGQTIYELLCGRCRKAYGANGCDTHHRRCPWCQGGKAGEPLRQVVSMPLF